MLVYGAGSETPTILDTWQTNIHAPYSLEQVQIKYSKLHLIGEHQQYRRLWVFEALKQKATISFHEAAPFPCQPEDVRWRSGSGCVVGIGSFSVPLLYTAVK